VVCVQAKDMKEPWCLATSLADEKAGILLKKYAKRYYGAGGETVQ
jgi:hypothetical protein